MRALPTFAGLRKIGVTLAVLVVLATALAGAGTAYGSAAKPTVWKWSKGVKLPGVTGSSVLGQLSCPSTSFCILDGQKSLTKSGNVSGVWWSSDPTGGASKWHFVHIAGFQPSGASISCSKAGNAYDCAMVGTTPGGGGVLYQTGHPNGSSWGTVTIDTNLVQAVSCWVNVQCAELDDQGTVLTTTGTTITSTASVFPEDAGFNDIWSIGCAPYKSGKTLCAAAAQGASDSIAWSTDPASGKWHKEHVGGSSDFDLVDCATYSLCIATEGESDLVPRIGLSFAPSKAGTWKSFKVPFKGFIENLSAVTCESATLCVFSGHNSSGNFVYVSTKPSASLSAWHESALQDGKASDYLSTAAGISCPSAKECVLVSGGGEIVIGKPS
jgi:hypothetical protein